MSRGAAGAGGLGEGFIPYEPDHDEVRYVLVGTEANSEIVAAVEDVSWSPAAQVIRLANPRWKTYHADSRQPCYRGPYCPIAIPLRHIVSIQELMKATDWMQKSLDAAKLEALERHLERMRDDLQAKVDGQDEDTRAAEEEAMWKRRRKRCYWLLWSFALLGLTACILGPAQKVQSVGNTLCALVAVIGLVGTVAFAFATSYCEQQLPK